MANALSATENFFGQSRKKGIVQASGPRQFPEPLKHYTRAWKFRQAPET
jgi:hypothetical protein